MDDSIFRKTELNVGDKLITLEFKKITDIFKFNNPPYIIVGVTTAGKTTLCLDILTKFSKDCTNIYYVTSTEENLKDDSISMIPRAYRRKPKYQILYNIWKEIKDGYASTNVDPSELSNMLIKLCGKQEATDIIKRLEEKRDQIQKEQLNKYRSLKLEESVCIQNAKTDGKAFYIDTLTHIILDMAKTKDTRSFSEKNMLILNSLISKAPKVMLLLDDVSSELDALKRNKQRVDYEGQNLAVSDAYKSLIIDILTRGRHYGALICLFLHSIDILQEKSYINNLILLNDASAQKVMNARTFPDDMRKTIGAVKGYVFNSSYPYHFLYLSGLSGEVAVGKADLHVNEELPLSQSNKMFVKAYDEIFAGITPSTKISSDDDNEYEEEDENNNDENDDIDSFIKAIT